MGCLYKLTSPSGKSYIGITSKNAEARWRQHRANAAKGMASAHDTEGRALYSAMRKYGASSFTLKVLAIDPDWSRLCELERAAIAAHRTFAPGGYNLTCGGDGATGTVCSLAARDNMSAAQKRRLQKPAQRVSTLSALRRAVESRSKRWWNRSEEERREWGARHSETVRRGHATAEAKARTSTAQRARWADPQARAAQSLKQTGIRRRPWTAERKAKAAETRRLEWADPIMRAKRLVGFERARQLHG